MENLSLYLLFALRAKKHGYIIRKKLQENGINVTHQYVYKTLRALENAELITGETQLLEGKPDRRIYKATAEGLRILRETTPKRDGALMDCFELAMLTEYKRHIDAAIQHKMEEVELFLNPTTPFQEYKRSSLLTQIDTLNELLK